MLFVEIIGQTLVIQHGSIDADIVHTKFRHAFVELVVLRKVLGVFTHPNEQFKSERLGHHNTWVIDEVRVYMKCMVYSFANLEPTGEHQVFRLQVRVEFELTIKLFFICV